MFTIGWRFGFLLLLPLSLFASAQEHNVLLPQPRQITYGPGKLSLKELRIVLPAHAAAEDRFAAEQLSSCLDQRSGLKIAVGTGPA